MNDSTPSVIVGPIDIDQQWPLIIKYNVLIHRADVTVGVYFYTIDQWSTIFSINCHQTWRKGWLYKDTYRNKIISFHTEPEETTLFLSKLKSKMFRLVSENHFSINILNIIFIKYIVVIDFEYGLIFLFNTFRQY